ncbi:mitochondrial carrier domain-containing protein [Gorgonomyces haynaldii]|nr:mitochondrial carrier domain-containing protein [Gorgonomyces haynaldii]
MDSTQMGSLHFFKTFFDKPLSTRDHAIAGMGAGIVVSFVATPIELLKAKLQVQYQSKVFSGPVDCARHLIKTNGILGLWQGLGACICFRSFFWVLWGSYDIYTRALDGLVPSESIPFLAGGLAANTFWTISFPFDQIKNTIMCQQPDKIQSIISTAKQTFSQFGVRGFYRGFVPCFLRSFPTNGAAIFVMEHTQQFLNGL